MMVFFYSDAVSYRASEGGMSHTVPEKDVEERELRSFIFLVIKLHVRLLKSAKTIIEMPDKSKILSREYGRYSVHKWTHVFVM